MLFRRTYPEIFSDEPVKKHPLFAGLSVSDLDEIAPVFTKKEIPPGDSFTAGNDPDISFFIVVEGQVDVTETRKEGFGTDAGVLAAGQSAGDMNLLEEGHSRIDCTARENTRILVLAKRNLDKLLRKESRQANRLYLNLCNCVSGRLDELNSRYTKIIAHIIATNLENLKRRKDD